LLNKLTGLHQAEVRKFRLGMPNIQDSHATHD
jgi:hypothetical protein